jgi:transposase
VRFSKVAVRSFGLMDTVVEDVRFDVDAVVIVVRAGWRARGRCGVCRRRSPGYDQGQGRRWWRAMDMGTCPVFVEAAAPRVRCRTHGVTVTHVPWARHDAGHTRDFDAQAAWLAVHTSKKATAELLRVAWRTVGAIVARVLVDVDTSVDRLAGIRRIAIDEVAYKRRFNYLTVVTDHDTGFVVWAAPGHDAATLAAFFDRLGPHRSAALTHVSADAAPWIAKVVAERAPQAVRCADPFHIVAWAVEALDVERRRAWNQAPGRHHRSPGWTNNAIGTARSIKRCRWALWKNPDHLTEHQHQQLKWIERSDPQLWRAYLLKEALRYVFTVTGQAGKTALDYWIRWARRSRIPAFVELQRRIVRHRAEIDATLDNGLTNAIAESTNTKIRVITRVAYGFHGPDPLIALIILSLGSHRPTLPGRQPPTQ